MFTDEIDHTGEKSSPPFSVGFVLFNSFLCHLLSTIVCLFVSVFLAIIILSVLFRITASNYPFGIFKFFLQLVLVYDI
jgi:hypothetical protein